MIKFLSVGHYHFSEKAYKNLINKINGKLDFQKKMNKVIEKYLASLKLNYSIIIITQSDNI